MYYEEEVINGVLMYRTRPDGVWREMPNEFAQVIEQLRKDKAKLSKALQLAKDMFIANDLSFPHTLEVIDDALNNHGASHD